MLRVSSLKMDFASVVEYMRSSFFEASSPLINASVSAIQFVEDILFCENWIWEIFSERTNIFMTGNKVFFKFELWFLNWPKFLAFAIRIIYTCTIPYCNIEAFAYYQWIYGIWLKDLKIFGCLGSEEKSDIKQFAVCILTILQKKKVSLQGSFDLPTFR